MDIVSFCFFDAYRENKSNETLTDTQYDIQEFHLATITQSLVEMWSENPLDAIFISILSWSFFSELPLMECLVIVEALVFTQRH